MFTILLISLLLSCLACSCLAFSTPSNDHASSSPFYLFDRFRHECPASINSIHKFDISLVKSVDSPADSDSTWVAVYRSNHNKPSVLIKDEFLNAMQIAVGGGGSSSGTASSNSSSMISSQSQSQERPVAVARLAPSQNFADCWILDSMRCWLKKEDTNPDCDGGSEHTEALSVAIDALLLHHLQHHSHRFEHAIRTKATLVSGALVDERGFRPVETLCQDMATHFSSFDGCMEAYADRVVSAKHPAARERALQIVTLLRRLDRQADMEAARQQQEDMDGKSNGKDDDGDYDPWAAIKQYL